MQILILTKNVLAERKIQNKLQELGHEVLCSRLLYDKLYDIKERHDFYNHFEVIILSQTLSDKEIELHSQSFSILHGGFIREISTGSNSFEEVLIDPLQEFISTDMPKSQIREILGNIRVKKIIKRSKVTNKGSLFDGSLEAFSGLLSNKERNLFSILYNRIGEVISREELCTAIWGIEDPKDDLSKLSMLSSMIKRLREKLEQYQLNHINIETVWSKGYKLTDIGN